MASYDLRCDACGATFEVFRQGFLRTEDKVCPSCGSGDVRQKFSSFLSSVGRDSGHGCATPPGSPFG